MTRRFTILYAALMAAAVPVCSFARGKTPVNVVAPWAEFSAARVFFRAIPSGSDGFYVVWSSTATGTPTLLQAQFFGTDGLMRWAAPGQGIAQGLVQPGTWDACSDGRGGLVVVDAENASLVVRRFDPQGKRSWEQRPVTVSSGTSIRTIVAADDRLGGPAVTWVQEGGGQSQVHIQRWSADGHPVWPNGGVTVTNALASQTQPNVTADGAGGLLVAWKSEREGASLVRVQRLAPDGLSLWPRPGVPVQAASGDLRQRITMAAPGKGGVVVAWTQGENGINRLFFQHVGPDGKRTWDLRGVTQQPPTAEQWNPVLFGTGEGSLWVAWEEIRTDVTAPHVKVVRRDPPKGEAWPAGELYVAQTPGPQGRIGLALDGQGGVVVVWIDNRVDVGVYLQQISSQGQMKYPNGRLLASTVGKPTYPHVVVLPDGHAAVVWAEEVSSGNWALKQKVISLQ